MARDQSEPKDVKLVPVRVFTGGTAAMDAELARSWLESEGIPCVLLGEYSARIVPVLECPLLVREQDAEEARTILQEYLSSNQSAPNSDSV